MQKTLSTKDVIPTRTIHHEDALVWLKNQKTLMDSSIITSLPDISEFPNLNLSQWQTWFVETAALVMSKCPPDGLSLFYQTDIKVDGAWIDKGFLIQKAAEKIGHSLVAHKIVCRAKPGVIRFGRPAYSHLIGFSKTIRPEIAKSFADVLPDAGESTWTRGMGIKACELACKMVLTYTKNTTIVDPFCGHGTVLAVANDLGLNAIGVELSQKRAKKARTLKLDDLKNPTTPRGTNEK